MAHLSVILSVVIVVIAALTFCNWFIAGIRTIEVFMASVSLAVAAIQKDCLL
jgi:magnesium-transporting ATPase (P-type)